jgi:hypothetical protein
MGLGKTFRNEDPSTAEPVRNQVEYQLDYDIVLVSWLIALIISNK